MDANYLTIYTQHGKVLITTTIFRHFLNTNRNISADIFLFHLPFMWYIILDSLAREGESGRNGGVDTSYKIHFEDK